MSKSGEQHGDRPGADRSGGSVTKKGTGARELVVERLEAAHRRDRIVTAKSSFFSFLGLDTASSLPSSKSHAPLFSYICPPVCILSCLMSPSSSLPPSLSLPPDYGIALAMSSNSPGDPLFPPLP